MGAEVLGEGRYVMKLPSAVSKWVALRVCCTLGQS